jgi:hypothetical protein
MKRVMDQCAVKPGRAAENEELVRAVYGEANETRPKGLRYARFKLDAGVSFVHLAVLDTGNPAGRVRELVQAHA